MQFHGATCAQLRDWAAARGLPPFRGQQIFESLYRHFPATAADCRGLPARLADTLQEDITAGRLQLTPAVESRRQTSRDGTVKSLLRLRDGRHVECVSIPTPDRHTVCVSSQVGCAVGCTFCASGLKGVQRDLSPAEIVYQVVHHHRTRPVTNVVFMGSGEPLFNYEAVLQAIAVLGDARGLGMGRRRITVSTSGVAPTIRRFGRDEPQVTLALSLHAPDDATRDRLVPLNRRWPIAELLAAMDDYSRLVNRRMTFEYVLLADANMQDEQARALARLARRYGAHINLIPFNPVVQTPHQVPTPDAVRRFAQVLGQAGGVYTLRDQRGEDIDAACGQLVLREEQPS